MFNSYQELINAITPTKKEIYEPEAIKHLDFLTKPKGSLGFLEELAAQMYTIHEGKMPTTLNPSLMVVAGADHGVWEEGIAMQPQEVTHQMIVNIATGGAAISVFAKHANMDMLVLDAGHIGKCDYLDNVKDISFAEQSKNIAKEAAMSAEICEKLILSGANEVLLAKEKGYKLMSIGEMGIGNSTPATAIYCALYDLPPIDVTGPGAGLAKEKLAHKAQVVQRALDKHAYVVNSKNPFEILSHLGGFEIAALCGVVLGSAACKLPVMIDGFISTSAYVIAVAMNNAVKDYAILSHASAEPGYKHVLNKLDQLAMLDLQMRLGEGTGCALAFSLVEASLKMYNEMANFDSAKVTFIEHENATKRKKNK